MGVQGRSNLGHNGVENLLREGQRAHSRRRVKGIGSNRSIVRIVRATCWCPRAESIDALLTNWKEQFERR